MLKNYFKIAWRNLVKNKFSSFINIGGLAVGMTVAMLIGLWINDELSFDKYHQHNDHIARVMQRQTLNGELNTLKAIPIPVAIELRRNFGNDFKYVVLSSWTNPHILKFRDKHISLQGNYMEPDAPEMLTLSMIKGTRNALKDPSSILIAELASKALFGEANPIGKTIMLDSAVLRVAGVYEDLPPNSSFSNLLFIAPWNVYASSEEIKEASSNWRSNSFQLFAQIAENRDMANVSAKIKNIKLNKVSEREARQKPEIFLFPMSRWHLYSEFKNGVNTGGAIQYVWLLGITGIFVLLLACINFMNLSTARSEKRAKEVGIRKTMGSLKGQLVVQFFGESLLVVIVAFVLSLIAAYLTLPFFNQVADKKMIILWSSPLFWLTSFGFCLTTALISGSYPAFYLSSFLPVKVLKGTFRVGSVASLPRKLLVVLQFSISIILIIATIIVFRQIQFAKERPIGYSRDGLIMVRPYSDDFHRHFEAMRNDLLQTGVILAMAESGNQITKGSRTSGGFDWPGKDPNTADEFASFAVSPDYGKTIGWQFITGRDFSGTASSDSSCVILNETAVKYMGLKNPVGRIITWGKPYTIIGVVKDLIVESPYEPVKQTVFYINPEAGLLNMRINPAVNSHEALTRIETICKKYAPDAPFDYKFVDEEYAHKFNDEDRIGKLATIFTVLAIFISCLGMFGLASFVAEQRTREIGIRKVLGASALNLWSLLSRDFVLLVLISLFTAIPVAYYFMHQWLQHFTYRAEMNWRIFAVTGLGAVIITLLTVSYQSIRAALANPVSSLRSE